jgi:hypothetical protein
MTDVNATGSLAATFPAIPPAPPMSGGSDFISFEDFFKELVRFCIKRGHCSLGDDLKKSKETAREDYDLLRKAIKEKNKEKAKEFLANFSRHFGLEPLSKPGGRAFWSGMQGKHKAICFQKGNDGKYTALEGSDFGAFFDQMKLGPFSESVTLWSVMSDEFAKGAQGDIVMFATEGLACHKVFWNTEVEQMRARQRRGTVENITIFVSRPASADDVTFRNSSHPEVHGEAQVWQQVAELRPGEQCARLPIMFDGALGTESYEGTDKDGKFQKWFAPKTITAKDAQQRVYDSQKLARFVDFLLPCERGEYTTSRGHLYGYGRQVLSGVWKKMGVMSALERMMGGLKVLLIDYDNFFIKEVFYGNISAGEFMERAYLHLDRYLEKNFAHFSQLPERIAVVGDAIVYKPWDNNYAAIQAIRPSPGCRFRSMAELLKIKRYLNVPMLPFIDLLQLRPYGGVRDLSTLHQRRSGVDKAVADIRKILRLSTT